MPLPFSELELPVAYRDPRVLAAMEKIPRAAFVLEDYVDQADQNCALPIDCGQTISQPVVVAYMTAGLGMSPGDRILEIGTGSGYQTALLAELGAEVFSVEVHVELSRVAHRTLTELGLSDRVHLRVGDGRHGWPTEAPFDGIICTAAPEYVPGAFVEQLKPGGRLVIPLGPQDGQILYVMERRTDLPSGFAILSELPVRFVPLVRPAYRA